MLSMVLCDIPYLQQIKFSRLAEIIWADKKLVLHVIQGTRLQKIRQIIKGYCQLIGFSSICCLDRVCIRNLDLWVQSVL